MKTLTILFLLLAFSVPAADPLPEAYQLILKRNVFDSTRAPNRPVSRPDTATPPPAPPPKQSVTLVGVVVVDGTPSAIMSSATETLSGIRQVGDTVAGMTISAIELAGITLVSTDGELRLLVGTAISGRPDEAWAIDHSPAPAAAAATAPATPTTPAAAAGTTTAPAATPEDGGGASDLIRRMRERRQREMQP